MGIVITIWGNRISPVFDSSKTLLIVEIAGNRIVNRSQESFAPDKLKFLERRLKELNISTVISGAISEKPAQFIEDSGFVLIPFISGFVDDVLESIKNNEPITPKFLMPGCKCQKRARGRCGKKR
jgi:predicted Fe-Mo cluster-binding NifX family protein